MGFPTGWSGYEEVHIVNMPSYITTTGQVFRIATTGFSTEWKNAVGASGQDIRVTTANGTRLPVDVVYMNNGTGHIEFNLTGDYPRDPREHIRFWAGNTGATFEPVTGTYGQYNVYPFSLFGYYPSGGGLDRTRYQNHLTGINTTTGEVHLSVFPSTFYSGAYSSCNMTGITGIPLTMVSYVKTYIMTGNQIVMGLFNSQSTGDAYTMHLRGSNDTSAISVRSASGNNTVGGDNYVSGEWGQFAGKFSLNNRRDIYKNGQQQASSTVAITGTGIDTFGLGTYLGLTQSGSAVAHLSFVELYSGGKSETSLLYDYNNSINNMVSHGWFPAFNPIGWSGYDEITINEQASGPLYDQTYLLSTCLLSPTLLSIAKADGGDLRIVKTDNATELPIDVIHFNNTQTGMIGFIWPGQKISGQVDKFRVWAGNSSANKYERTGQFGQYNVYSTGMIAFYPSGGGQDRTSGQRHMTGVNVSSGNTVGPLSGLYATSFPGTPANMACLIPQADRRPINIFSVFETDRTTPDQVIAALGAISNSKYNNAIRLNSSTGITHHVDVNAGSLEVIATSGFTINTWYSADAYQDEGSMVRNIRVNGDNLNSGTLPFQFGTSRLSIGGYSGTLTPSTGDYLDGTVSLTIFDTSKRYGYEPIYNYHMIFDHPNFYTANGWTTFGSESSGSSISLESIVNVFTNSYGTCDINISFQAVCLTNTNSVGSTNLTLSFGGNSNTYTYSNGSVDNDNALDLLGEIRSTTHSSGQLSTLLSLAGNSNSYTNSSATLVDNVLHSLVGEINARTSAFGGIVSNISLAGASDSSSSISGNIILNIPLSSIVAVNTALQGGLTVSTTGCGVDPSTVEFMVYLTMNAPNPLYITRNHSSVFYHVSE